MPGRQSDQRRVCGVCGAAVAVARRVVRGGHGEARERRVRAAGRVGARQPRLRRRARARAPSTGATSTAAPVSAFSNRRRSTPDVFVIYFIKIYEICLIAYETCT